MSDPETPDRVFVYGTLMPGRSNAHVARAAGLVATEPATLSGFTLYHLEPEGYPAIAPGSGAVEGVVLIFKDITHALDVLDALEGCDRSPPLYVREVRSVAPVGAAWVYIYHRLERLKQPGAVPVPNGRWTPP